MEEEALGGLPEGEPIPHSLATDKDGHRAYALVWSRHGVVTSVRIMGYYTRAEKGWRAVSLDGSNLGVFKLERDAKSALLQTTSWGKDAKT